ncbi:MAG: outer membrane protein assembly factor BamA [Alphaproteobacteria bacterium CG11_big_fil_rev_8_21_14_0_20_44_7]|nr:MAG: outer membrane protein assembly factor BamA [Alphaproteobacteria bacterium CG11_big_fil_rev_8_21_14_0_20_44_7]
MIDEHFYKRFKIGFAALVFVSLVLPQNASAEIVKSINIEGNQRVDVDSVMSYITFKEGAEYDSARVNESIKTLFATGLFSDVEVKESDGYVNIIVTENPIISRVAYEGNRGISDDKLAAEVTLEARSIYTKAAVQDNVQRIADIYRKSGRFNARVEPKVILKEQNRVDLIFEIDEGKTTEIKKIIFLGNNAFDDSDLLSVIRSTEDAWYNFFTSDDTYDADRIEYDKELLRRFYTKNGYADFRASSAIGELTKDGEGFVLTYSVEEGDKYQFGKINIVTQLDELRPEQLDDDEEIIRTAEGDDYDASRVETTIDNLVEKAGEKGFAFVEIEPMLSRDEEKDIIDITYVVKEGVKVFVDRVNINGNTRTLDKVIRREMRLSEGDPFNTSKLKTSKQKIERLNFFDGIDISKEQGDAPDKVDINIDVKEKSTGELNFGAGLSSTDGVLGEVSIVERNLLGKGQYLKFNITASSRAQQGQLSFTEPRFLDKEVYGGFDLFHLERDYDQESSYKSVSTGLNLKTGYNISEDLAHNIVYGIVSDDIRDVDPIASRFIRDQEGKTITSKIGQSFIYDKRDSSLTPRDGYMVRFSQEIAGLGGDNRFLKQELGASYYYPVTEDKDWFMTFAGNAGNVFGIGKDVPINHRFFLGGRNFRGFSTGGVGPRDSISDDSLGGNNYYTVSSELGFPLGISEEFGLSGAFFVDAGSLWGLDDDGPEVVDSSSLRMTVGMGLGWQSPFGPLRIDFGVPVLKDGLDEKESFQFNFGTRF